MKNTPGHNDDKKDAIIDFVKESTQTSSFITE